MSLDKHIREIKDFPRPGIGFKDITPLLLDPVAFKSSIELLHEKAKDKKIDKIVAIESRGFIFGSALAHKMGIGLVPVRKKGKLPAKCISYTYSLEYGEDTLEMHEDALLKNESVLIIDDLLATGGTAEAAASMVEKLGAKVSLIAFVIELEFLKGKERLKKFPVISLIKYS
ncbi:MAG TPA: adenine phosphoribosyltransferase [Candidatus Omnitrophica bacterium]|nr:adenine phosphoribosyltransferase [Candidatus Omnitrophota bacterium]